MSKTVRPTNLDLAGAKLTGATVIGSSPTGPITLENMMRFTGLTEAQVRAAIASMLETDKANDSLASLGIKLDPSA